MILSPSGQTITPVLEGEEYQGVDIVHHESKHSSIMDISYKTLEYYVANMKTRLSQRE